MNPPCLAIVAIAFTSWAADPACASSDTWTVSFTREFSSSPVAWTGVKGCIDNYIVQLIANSTMPRFEHSDRQVDCEVDAFNNAVCVSVAEGMPRKGAFLPSTNEIVASELMFWRGNPTTTIFTFKVKLDSERRPISGSTEIRYAHSSVWPAGPKEEIARLDLVAPNCVAEFKTTIVPIDRQFGTLPDSTNGHALLNLLTLRSQADDAEVAGRKGQLLAHTLWPSYMPDLTKGVSISRVPAPFPPADVIVETPGRDIPAERAAWSGSWRGWSGRGRVKDHRLVISRVTASGATAYYSVAGESIGLAPSGEVIEAHFVGDELQAQLSSTGATLYFRMRKPGEVEILWQSKYNEYSAGVLTKESN